MKLSATRAASLPNEPSLGNPLSASWGTNGGRTPPSLLQQVQQALGGVERLASVKDFRAHARVTYQAQNITVATTSTFVAPSSVRAEWVALLGNGGTGAQYCNGQTGWRSTPQGTTRVSEAALAEFQYAIFIESPTFFLADHNPDRTVRPLATDTLEISDNAGHSALVKVDPTTHLPSRITYKTASGTVEVAVSDWRDIE